MFTEKVASLFNSELITRVCRDIDNNHEMQLELKVWLLQLIKGSVDLSVQSLSNKEYQEAYNFVKNSIEI